jgi:hypothetical protein
MPDKFPPFYSKQPRDPALYARLRMLYFLAGVNVREEASAASKNPESSTESGVHDYGCQTAS